MRQPRLDDFLASAAMWADPEIVRHISGTPSTNEQTWSRLLRYIGHWAALGMGYWVVEEAATGKFVGEVGFAYHRRNIEPPIDVPELGWVIARGAQGKGYATEAARAAVAWAKQRLDAVDEIACIIAPENRASIHVAEKCGFTLACETSYMNLPALVYRLRRL
jgi:RimJ/RimL family protein N-acetyltransferase